MIDIEEFSKKLKKSKYTEDYIGSLRDIENNNIYLFKEYTHEFIRDLIDKYGSYHTLINRKNKSISEIEFESEEMDKLENTLIELIDAFIDEWR